MSTPNPSHTLGGSALGVALSVFSAGAVAAGAQAPSNDPRNLPEITFSVPYSFSNLDPGVMEATIRCGIGEHSGETRIILAGQSRNGTATVIARPQPGARIHRDYTKYSCAIVRLTKNGLQYPQDPNNASAQAWARPAIGSVLEVSGPIK